MKKGMVTVSLGTFSALSSLLVPSVSAAAESKQPVVVRILFNDQGALADKLFQDQIGGAYMKAHPNVKLEWQFIPENQIDTKTVLAVNSGNPPNLVVVYADVAMLAKKGVLIPLDNQYKKTHINPNIFVQPSWQATLVNDQSYAFPAASTPGMVLWYNPGAMKAAGLNPNKPPRTWDELMKDSLKAVKIDKSGKLERVGLEFNDTYFTNYETLFAGGQDFWKQQGSTWTPDPTNPKNAAYLMYLKKLADAYGGWARYSKFIASDQGWGGSIDYLAQGKALFTIDGYWDYTGFAQYAPKFKFAATYAPTQHGLMKEQIAHPVTQWAVAFPKGQDTASFNAAWDFANWAFNTHSYMLGPTTNGSTVLNQQKQWIQYTSTHFNKGEKLMGPYLHYATDVLPYAKEFVPPLPIASYYSTQLTTAADSVLLGKATPQQALASVAKNVQTQTMISG